MIVAAAFVLAQVFHTPSALMTPTPAPVSERAVLDQGLDQASARARTLGGTLGAVIVDVTTGTSVTRNADMSLPLSSADKLITAVLALRAVDSGTLHLDQTLTLQPGNAAQSLQALLQLMLEHSDSRSADAVLNLLGGSDAANAQLRMLGYTGLLMGPHQSGYGTPSALASLLAAIRTGPLLSDASRALLLRMMADSQTGPHRLRAAFPAGTLVAHRTGTAPLLNGVTRATNDLGIVTFRGRTFIIVAMLRDARGEDEQRDAVIADVARAVSDAAGQVTP